MAIEAHLEIIRQRFAPAERQILAKSLQQDGLVWQCIQNNTETLTYFENAEPDLSVFSPSRLALWLIEQREGISLADAHQWETALPNEIKQLAANAFESTFNSGLPPADLATAGLLALALRERRKIKGDWIGIADEILLKRGDTALQKNLQIWQTPFACLFSLCPDFDTLLADFFQTKNRQQMKTAMALSIHATLAAPSAPQDQLDRIFRFVSHATMDVQLDALQSLYQNERQSLSKTLAQNLIQSKQNTNTFAGVFAELSQFQTDTKGTDPLGKQVSFHLAENLNRLAAFNFFAGQSQKASELYQQAGEILGFIQAQILFQSVACEPQKADKSAWAAIQTRLPQSLQIQYFYIQTLLESGEHDEARQQIKQLPDSPEKVYFYQMLGDNVSKSNSEFEINQPSLSPNHKHLASLSRSYWAHSPKFNLQNAKLQASARMPFPIQNNLVAYLDYANLAQVVSVRDMLMNDHRYDQAIELTSYLELAELDDPTHSQTLAQLYGFAKRWPQAYATIQQIVKAESNPTLANLLLFAESALHTDRTDMALSICQSVLQQDPQNPKALILLGEGFWQKGDIVKAIQHMEKVVETIPTEGDTWLALARIWLENGQTDRAIEVLHQGVLALPDHPCLLRQLGKLHLDKQSPADALTFLKKAFEVDPQNTEGQLNLARAAYQLGHLERAWNLLEPYMNQPDQDQEVSRLLGHVLLAMEKNSQAKPILLQAAKQFPEDQDTVCKAAHLVIASAEESLDGINTGELTDARGILLRSLELTPEDFDLQVSLADIERLAGNDQQAFETYSRISEQSSAGKTMGHWQLQYGLGKSAVALGKLDLGLAALQEAFSQQPENTNILHALAESYLSAGLSGKAVDVARTALKLAPQEIPNILWFAQFQLNNHDAAEAVKVLKEALLPVPHQPELKLWLARTLISTGETQEAFETLQQLVNSSPASTSELHQAAYLGVQINQMDLTIQALEKAVQLTEHFNPLLVMDLAVAYAAHGHQRKALETLNLDQTIYIKYPEVALIRADILNTLSQYEHALNTLRIIEGIAETQLGSNNQQISHIHQSPLLYSSDFSLAGFYYRLGVLTQSSGNLVNAQQYLEKAYSVDPENEKIRLAVAEIHLSLMDFQRALTFLDSQKHSEPNQVNLDLVCARAEALYYLDDPRQATAVIESITAGLTSYPRLMALRSRSAGWMGESDVARECLNEAIQAYQNSLDQPENATVEMVHQQIMNLAGIASAAQALGDLPLALDLQSQAVSKIDNQPLQSWLYVQVLLQSAKAQRVAEGVSIVTHAPCTTILSDESKSEFQRHLSCCQPYLPHETWLCLSAEGIADFDGQWPIDLDPTPCLNNPASAAAVILANPGEIRVRQALEVHPNQPQVLQAAGIYALHHPLLDGVQIAEKALQFDPVNPINHALLAYLNRDLPEAAYASITTALKFWSNEPNWHAYAAELAAQLGHSMEAEIHMREALDADPNNATLWEQSAALNILDNDLAIAKHDLEESITHQPKQLSAWLKLADVNRKLGDLPEAILNIQKAGELDPQNASIAIKEAQFLLDQSSFSAAIEKTNAILEADQTQDQARIIQAQAYAKQGFSDQALDILNSASQADPDKIDLRLAAVKIKREFNGTEETLPELITLAEVNPDNAQVLTLLTDWLIQTNRLEKAKTTAQTILKILPQEAEVHLMLGRLQRMNGQLDQAIAHLVDALAYDPTLLEAYIELGKTYQDRRDLEKAIEVFQKGTEIDALDPRPYYFAGMALKECKDYAAAEAMLKQAKRCAPEDSNIIRQLGVVTAMNLINHLRETS